MAATIVIITGAAVLGAVLLGMDWWTDRSTAAEVLAVEISTESDSDLSGVPSTVSDLSGIDVVPSLGGLVQAHGDGSVSTSSLLPQLPPPMTIVPVVVPNPSTTGEPSTPSTSRTPSTIAPTTTLQVPTTSSGPTTTSTASAATTIIPPTATTLPANTTTAPETTTTCAGNSGSGKGTGPCGP